VLVICTLNEIERGDEHDRNADPTYERPRRIGVRFTVERLVDSVVHDTIITAQSWRKSDASRRATIRRR
jgi:hypothetical protein